MAISTKTTYTKELEKDIHDLIMGRQDIITYESSFDELNVYRSMKIQVRKLAELLADLGYRKIDDQDDIAAILHRMIRNGKIKEIHSYFNQIENTLNLQMIIRM